MYKYIPRYGKDQKLLYSVWKIKLVEYMFQPIKKLIKINKSNK